MQGRPTKVTFLHMFVLAAKAREGGRGGSARWWVSRRKRARSPAWPPPRNRWPSLSLSLSFVVLFTPVLFVPALRNVTTLTQLLLVAAAGHVPDALLGLVKVGSREPREAPSRLSKRHSRRHCCFTFPPLPRHSVRAAGEGLREKKKKGGNFSKREEHHHEHDSEASLARPTSFVLNVAGLQYQLHTVLRGTPVLAPG